MQPEVQGALNLAAHHEQLARWGSRRNWERHRAKAQQHRDRAERMTIKVLINRFGLQTATSPSAC